MSLGVLGSYSISVMRKLSAHVTQIIGSMWVKGEKQSFPTLSFILSCWALCGMLALLLLEIWGMSELKGIPEANNLEDGSREDIRWAGITWIVLAAVSKRRSLGYIHLLTCLLESRPMIKGTYAFWLTENLARYDLEFALGVSESTVIYVINVWASKANVDRAGKKWEV